MTAGLVVAALVMLLGAAVGTARAASGRSSAVRRLLGAAGRPWVLGTALPAPPAWVATALVDAGVMADGPAVWTFGLAALAVLVAACLAVGGPALACLALIASVAGSAVFLRARRGSGDARFEAALPLALEAVARALRSGASLRQAVDESAASTPGPLGAELDRVAAEAGHGRPLVAALEGLAARRPMSGVRLAVAALCLGVETGGAQARAIDGVAATLRDRLAVSAELRALSAQARISALVIGLAPIGFGAFAAATDPRTSGFLLHTPAGLVLLGAGLLLDAAGWLWMRRLCHVGV